MADGDEMPFDLFLGVPVHRAPQVVQESGLCVDGWIPVDPLTLATAFPDVYAVGDVTSVGTPKAGVFAEGQAGVVADAIIARVQRDRRVHDVRRPRHLLPRVRRRPGRQGRRDLPARTGAGGAVRRAVGGARQDKADFGSSRIRRWFGREWSAH